MIKHCWSVLCQNIITDAETNVASYVMTVDNISASELPAKIPFLAIGTSWSKDTSSNIVENFVVRISHVSPRGKSTSFIETGDIAMASYRHRMNFLLNGFTFHEVGMHSFFIEAKINGFWTEASSLPVFVVSKNQLNMSIMPNTTKQ